MKNYLFEEYTNYYIKKGFSDIHELNLNLLKRQYESSFLINKARSNIYRFSGFKKNFVNEDNFKVLFTIPPSKFRSIYFELSKKTTLLLTSFSRDVFLKKNIYFVDLFSIFSRLYRALLLDNDEVIDQSLTELLETLELWDPSLILVDNDALPDKRALIYVANELGIPTVEIQHGVYQSDYLPTGRYVDYVFVWGKFFKRLYLKSKIKSKSQIKILGYPYDIKNDIKKRNKRINDRPLVYYLGQNFECYNRDLIRYKIKTLKELDEIFDELGFNFYYKPHPSDEMEIITKNLPHLKISSLDLFETFKEGDIFISFNSTALVEASIYNKITFQLINYPIPTENYEEIGACYKSCGSVDEIYKYLTEKCNFNEIEDFTVSRDYIEIPEPNPGKRFLELISELDL